MRVVWAYTDWTKEGNFDIKRYPLDEYALVESALSWMYYAPEYERVFYADQIVYDYFKSNNYLNLWDRVEIVDFEKELRDIQGVDFFAYPKIWAMTRQKEPFWICDTDVALFRRPEELVQDCTKIHGNLYQLQDEGLFGYCREQFDKKGIGCEGFEPYKLTKELHYLRQSGVGTFIGSVGINGGTIFYPDPDVAKVIGYALFSGARLLARELQGVPESDLRWTLWEELFLYGIMTTINQKPVQLSDSERSGGCYHIGVSHIPTLKEVQDRIKDVTNTVKIDAFDYYPLLLDKINSGYSNKLV